MASRLLTTLLIAALAPALSAATITVSSTGDDDIRDGVITLREAIELANGALDPMALTVEEQALLIGTPAAGQADAIEFEIPGAAPFTIQPGAPLPEIGDAATIDGTTQTGFTGAPVVELSGASIPAGIFPSGLVVSAADCTVRGLAINRFRASGILINAAGNCVVVGCFLGTDVTGTLALGNTSGVFVNNSPNNRIGGSTLEQRNLISGNTIFGISISSTGSTGNQVLGNFIGTDAGGTKALANGQSGVDLFVTGANVIGDSGGGANVISGNGADGVFIAGAVGNVVRGNLIGTDAAGTAPLGNGRSGVRVQSATLNVVGPLGIAGGNVIAFNTEDGVTVEILPIVSDFAFGNAISLNSIHSNGGLGIDLVSGAPGVTPNDDGDADTGANGLQNFPEITDAHFLPLTLVVLGSLNSSPEAAFSVQVFASATRDPSGNGEGQTCIWSSVAATDASGDATFTFVLPTTQNHGRYVTATATNLTSLDTSEFSPSVQVTGLGPSTAEIVEYLLGVTADPMDYNVNGDAGIDSADVVANLAAGR